MGQTSGYEDDHSHPPGSEIKNIRKRISTPFMYESIEVVIYVVKVAQNTSHRCDLDFVFGEAKH